MDTRLTKPPITPTAGGSERVIGFGATVGMIIFLVVPHLACKGFPEYMHIKEAAIQTSAVILLGYSLCAFKGRIEAVAQSGILLPAVLILALGLPLFQAPNPVLGISKVIHWTASLLLGHCLSLYVTSHNFHKWLTVLTIGGGLTATLGIFQYGWDLDWFEQARAPAAAFSNKNMAAQWIVMVWPATILLLFLTLRTRLRLIVLSAAILMLVYLLLAESKASILAMAIQSAFLATLHIRNRLQASGTPKLRKQHLLLLALLPPGIYSGFLLASQNGHEGDPRFWRSDPMTSWEIRRNSWLTAFPIMTGHPLGIGAGQFEEYYHTSRFADSGDAVTLSTKMHRAHNDWLQLTLEGGILAALALLGISVICLSRIAKIAFGPPRTGGLSEAMPVLAAAGLIGLGINAFFSYPLYCDLPPVMAAFFYSLLICSRSDANVTQSAPKSPSPQLLMACVFATIALAAMMVITHAKRLAADRLLYKQAQAFQSGNFVAAEAYGSHALNLWRFQTGARDLKGRALLRMGKFQEALKEFTVLLESSPHNPSYLYHYAAALFSLGQLDEAIDILTPLAKLFPEDLSILDLLGCCYYGNGSYVKAYEAFHQASEMNPANMYYIRNLAASAWKAGWNELALNAFRYCLMFDPENQEIKDWIKQLEQNP